MSDPKAPAPSPAETADLPGAAHIVLFGMPAAGKSSLLGALAQAAQAQEHLLNGRLNDLSHGLAELRTRLYDETARRTAEEVVPYPIDYEPFRRDARTPSAGEHVPAVVIDCDGRVANDLLVRHPSLEDDSPEGTLAHEVAEADTLVLVIDAAAPPAQVEADFGEFDRFLRQMERGRGRRAEVGGLPVFLVLTKCDLLAQPGDTAAGWIERIEERKRDVDARFRAFLARRQQEAGPLPFGRIDLHLWATAVKRPALAGTPAKPREPYGVAELFRQCLEAAAEFRSRRRQSGRRLLWTVGGAAGLAALLVSLAVGQYVHNSGGGPSRLEGAVAAFRFSDHDTAGERLGRPAGELRHRLNELERIRDDPGFPSMSADDQKLVRERVEELQSYLGYLDRLRQERRPGDVETEQALRDMKDRLQTGLALPNPEWQTTEAGQLHRDRIKDADALEKAVARVRNWYLDASEKANALWTFKGSQAGPEGPGIDWQAWSREVEQVLDPNHKVPYAEGETIPGSATGLTYAAALRFRKVVEARADWESDRRRLRRLLNLTAALRLATVKDKPAVLVFPRDVTLEMARARLQELRQAYPDYEKEFLLDDLPDAVRPKVRQVARTNYEYLLEPARALVLRQVQQAGTGTEETRERWEAVRGWLKDPEELAAWRVLAVVLARLYDPDAGDPVSALASFLQKSSFTIAFSRVVVEVPDSLRVKPGADAAFKVYYGPADGPASAALVFEQSGEGERQAQGRVWTYTFRLVEGQRIVYRPGDWLWATLPLRDGQMFTWARDRSSLYRFERLLLPPRLHKADEPNINGSRQEGVRLTFFPPDGVPRVPDLMPEVQLGR
jgi:hypothetical protein